MNEKDYLSLLRTMHDNSLELKMFSWLLMLPLTKKVNTTGAEKGEVISC